MTQTQRASRQSLMTGLVLREPRIWDIRTLCHSFGRLRVPKPVTAYFDTLHLDVRCDSSPSDSLSCEIFRTTRLCRIVIRGATVCVRCPR